MNHYKVWLDAETCAPSFGSKPAARLKRCTKLLPDYPEAKEVFAKFLAAIMRAENRKALGPFSQVRRSIVHEGHRMKIVREDGSEGEYNLQEYRSKVEVKTEEITNFSLDRFLEFLLETARNLANEQRKSIYKSISDSTDKTGNVISTKGKPPSPEDIFEIYRKIQIDFKDTGEIEEGMFFSGGEDAVKAFMKAAEEIEKDPVLRQQMDQIIRQKSEEFRVRESSRKLVG